MNGDPSLIDMPKMDRSSLSCESSSKEGVILIEEFGSFHDKLQTPTLLPLWWTSQGCQLPPEASPQCFTSSSSRASRVVIPIRVGQKRTRRKGIRRKVEYLLTWLWIVLLQGI